MISSRFAPAVCALIALALVPTLIHSYAGVVAQDGLRASTLPETLAGFTPRPTDRDPTWGLRRFESEDWIERAYGTGAGEVTLTVLRSHDLKALYHHPELAVAYGTDFEKSRIATFDSHPEVPVHVLETGLESGPVALYVLHYDDRFVSDPIWFQMRTAGEQLFRGRRAMTLFFARDPDVPLGDDLSTRPSLAILFAAIDQFVRPLAPS